MNKTKQLNSNKISTCEECSIPKSPEHIRNKLVQIRDELISRSPNSRPSWDITNDAIGSVVDRTGRLTDCTYDCLELKFLGKCPISSTIDLDEL